VPSTGGLVGLFDQDIKTKCCSLSDNCQIYRAVRPVDFGLGYIKPRIGAYDDFAVHDIYLFCFSLFYCSYSMDCETFVKL
jgi:hypothetical protein